MNDDNYHKKYIYISLRDRQICKMCLPWLKVRKWKMSPLRIHNRKPLLSFGVDINDTHEVEETHRTNFY